jgi:hypothetical protein
MFRVEWLQEAVGELADLWIKPDSQARQAITEATHNLVSSQAFVAESRAFLPSRCFS